MAKKYYDLNKASITVIHPDTANAENNKYLNDEIEFKDVTFSYIPGQPVIKNFNLLINKGQKIALVGATGSGKTTITKATNAAINKGIVYQNSFKNSPAFIIIEVIKGKAFSCCSNISLNAGNTKTNITIIIASTILKTVSGISTSDNEKIKKAAIFIALADSEVSKGYKQALKNDKSINFGKRLIGQINPLDFIPKKAKKTLLKNFGRKIITNYLNKKLTAVQTNTFKHRD